MQSSSTKKNRILGLDALRGFAALAILVYHCNALLKLHNWPGYTAYLSLAVQIFFGLSAFSLCYGYQGGLKTRDQFYTFWRRRFFRIAPLFYAMILWFVLRCLWMGWNLPSYEVFLLNLTFLFPIFPGLHESLVAAGWSLGIEMFFYATFPLLVTYLTNLRRALTFFALAVLLQSIAGYLLFKENFSSNFHWMAFPVQFPFFIAGIVVFHIYQQLDGLRSHHRMQVAIGTAALAVILIWGGIRFGFFEIRFAGWPGVRPLMGYLLSMIILSFALQPFAVLVNRPTVFLGEISYGLYLIHPPVIGMVGARLRDLLIAEGFSGWSVSIPVIVCVFAVTTAISALSYQFLERPMIRLGGRRPKVLRSSQFPLA
ncbi:MULTISPECIES: acyltransferase family protein [Agrobacterium]|uniref:acyltransferase family protein n=1 Tax=Agrobacterium TaxID=357 RepID=UPI000FDCFA43|nr:acyltransferase [Agrobacterium sp. RS6]UXU07945.1 acyltransferase [Agrobacterium tumefaciens]